MKFVGPRKSLLINRPSGYIAQGVHFDGATDAQLSNVLTGVADSKQGTFVVSVNIAASPTGTFFEVLHAEGGHNNLFLDYSVSGDTFRLRLFNSAGTGIVDYTTVSHFAGLGWKTMTISWDLTGPTLQWYINGVSDGGSAATLTNDTASFSPANFWSLGSAGTGVVDYVGDMADLWFNSGTFFDFSVGGNMAKFYSNGHPVNKGSSGSIPTGTSPIVFLSGAPASWNVNKGTGPGFLTTHGTITAAATNP